MYYSSSMQLKYRVCWLADFFLAAHQKINRLLWPELCAGMFAVPSDVWVNGSPAVYQCFPVMNCLDNLSKLYIPLIFLLLYSRLSCTQCLSSWITVLRIFLVPEVPCGPISTLDAVHCYRWACHQSYRPWCPQMAHDLQHCTINSQTFTHHVLSPEEWLKATKCVELRYIYHVLIRFSCLQTMMGISEAISHAGITL